MKYFLLFAFITTYVFPQRSKLSEAVHYLSKYIASERFSEIRNNDGDISAVDSLYLEAVKFYENDFSEALLALVFTTVPEKQVPIRIPFIGIKINYPLISADDSTYLRKNENLPCYLFQDTPKKKEGDKDKLAHFFGSAFLSYNTNIFDFTLAIGYFVEAFEESFKVESKMDYRDMKTNELGKNFGNMLKKDKSILPSYFMGRNLND